jgi:hypothetical protein
MEMYMELQLYLHLLFTSDVSMVSIDVLSSQTHDENAIPLDVEQEYYYHDLFKLSEVNPFQVVFGLKGVLARLRKSFKPCILTPIEWYRNPSRYLYVIPRPNKILPSV